MFKSVKNKLTDCVWVKFAALVPHKFAVKNSYKVLLKRFKILSRLTARRNSLNFPETFILFNINLPWGVVYLYELNITFVRPLHIYNPWTLNKLVHSCQQKSIGLKFSKSQTGSDVSYSCHHNSSRFTFPIFAHSCRFSVLHSLQSITPRIY